ncbi:MAG TPA: DUF547 domain-containing protein [Burkholderiales bacterium]|jgi:hypothetical protein
MDELAAALEAVRTAHFDAGGTACDYAALAASPERAQLAECLAGLTDYGLRGERVPAQMAFWINVFNAGALRDAAELQGAKHAREVQAYFERPRLRIGPHDYSLDDIEHGLLRGNVAKPGRLRAPMQRGDPRLASMPIVFDERIHFALHSACRSSPALRVYLYGWLDRQLEDATASHIRQTVRVEKQGALIVVPRLFKWFAQDFGGESGIVEFVVARIEDEAVVDMVDQRLGRVKLQYAEFDWTLNRR